jgi:hypothetical protein
MASRDAAEALIDILGWIMGTDPSLPVEHTDAVAEIVGQTLAGIAHETRSSSEPLFEEAPS